MCLIKPSISLWVFGLACSAFLTPTSSFIGSNVANKYDRAFGISQRWTKPQGLVLAASSVDEVDSTESGSISNENSQEKQVTELSLESGELVPERCIELLNAAIGYDASAASIFITELNEARATGKMTKQDVDELLNEVLQSGPDSRKIPFWAKWLPVARFSRRARLALLGRTLNKVTPPPSENSSSLDENDNKEEEVNATFALEKRRRALVGLLRSIANTSVKEEEEEENNNNKSTSSLPTIVRLIRTLKQEGKTQNAEDLRTRLPEGLETPEYDVIRESGPAGRVEIRRYKPFAVCSVSMTKPRPEISTETDAKVQLPEMTGSSSFGALAGYLFGKNEQKTSMKMTTPVITTPNGQAQEKEMSFILPSTYWQTSEALSEAPTPLAGSGVTLKRRELNERAVIMFGGYASKQEVTKRKKQLLDALEKDREWKAVSSDVEVFQYNDPFTVPWRRLNEVSVAVEMK